MALDDYRITTEPYYRPVGREVEQFTAAYASRLPVMLKGPTGCGKSRFIGYMAWKLGRPLITVSCHEDMTASDLVGRFLLEGDATVWHDGPLTRAVREGAICYLDEIVEARQDTTVVIHSLTDDRRILPLEKKNELVTADADFELVISYNPGYQSVLKDLKESTKQRFCAIDFGYPEAAVELEIVAAEFGGRAEAGGQAGADRRAVAQPQGPRPRGRRLDPDADPCRQAGRQRHPARRGLHDRAGPADHRRPRHARRPRGSDRRVYLRPRNRWPPRRPVS